MPGSWDGRQCDPAAAGSTQGARRVAGVDNKKGARGIRPHRSGRRAVINAGPAAGCRDHGCGHGRQDSCQEQARQAADRTGQCQEQHQVCRARLDRASLRCPDLRYGRNVGAHHRLDPRQGQDRHEEPRLRPVPGMIRGAEIKPKGPSLAMATRSHRVEGKRSRPASIRSTIIAPQEPFSAACSKHYYVNAVY